MGSESNKFKCPHCQELIDIDMIYIHVRKIFNGTLYKCGECDFTTNDEFCSEYHKSTTGHKIGNNNGLDPLLEDVINATAIKFMNSVLAKGSNANVVKNVKPKKVVTSERTKKSVSSNVVSSSESDSKKKSTKEVSKNFTLGTIIAINNMAYEYEKENYSSKSSDVVEVSLGARLPKQTYNVPLPLYVVNKKVTCYKCKEEVDESYLARRKHVFVNHQQEVMESITSTKKLKKADILFAGFKFIRVCFPNQVVCTDFQCIECGLFYYTASGVKYHVGVFHQRSAMIKCPFKNCNFESGSSCQAKDHIRKHLKEKYGGKNDISMKYLFSYVSPEAYANFQSTCRRERQLTQSIAKHYFPISMTCYGNFETGFSDALLEFKKSYLQPYVLCNLSLKNRLQNGSELFQSHSEEDILLEDDEDFIDSEDNLYKEDSLNKKDVSSGGITSTSNVSSRKRPNISNPEGDDIIFIKEVDPESKKKCSKIEKPVDERSSSKDNCFKSEFVENSKKSSDKKTVEDSKHSVFTKQIPPLSSVTSSFSESSSDHKTKKEFIPTSSNKSSSKNIKTETSNDTSERKSNLNSKELPYKSQKDIVRSINSQYRRSDYNWSSSHSKSGLSSKDAKYGSTSSRYVNSSDNKTHSGSSRYSSSR